MKKVAIFVDVQNIYYTTREAFGQHFNYQVFLDKVLADRELVTANAYAIDRGDAKQAGFQQILRDIGFEVKLKPYIQRSDGSTKGDWDVGITLDLVEAAEEADEVILASGDGDFDLALIRIRDRFRTESIVYGVRNLTAGSLIEAADQYHAIDEELLIAKRTSSR